MFKNSSNHKEKVKSRRIRHNDWLESVFDADDRFPVLTMNDTQTNDKNALFFQGLTSNARHQSVLFRISYTRWVKKCVMAIDYLLQFEKFLNVKIKLFHCGGKCSRAILVCEWKVRKMTTDNVLMEILIEKSSIIDGISQIHYLNYVNLKVIWYFIKNNYTRKIPCTLFLIKMDNGFNKNLS